MSLFNYIHSLFSSPEEPTSCSGGDQQSQREPIPFWTLNVTVLRATTKSSYNLLSQSDLFVTLYLPTAAVIPYRTKTINNNNNPEWNETFSFKFPIQVKNILEIKLYNVGLLRTQLIDTIMLDISTLLIGEKETRTLLLNQETNKLVMEFELVKSDEISDAYRSNGVVVTAPITALDVGVKELINDLSVTDMSLKINGSYQGTQPLDETQSENLRFYINRDLETEMSVIPNDHEDTSGTPIDKPIPLDPPPPDRSIKVSLDVGKDVVDLDVETNEHHTNEPKVRLHFDIPPEEKAFLSKRKAVVAEALQKLLGLRSELQPEQVPTIAVVASGGGSRAMTGLLGGLKALKEAGILDTVTYITGVSGSTWTMSALYQDTHWSTKDMDTFIAAEKTQITKSFLSAFTPAQLHYYHEELKAKQADGHLVSFSDMAGLVFEHLIFGKKVSSTLSEQQKTVSEGQNPFPIYTAVHMKDNSIAESEWCEFTPCEVGLIKYGAFIPTEDFDSHFFLGHLVKKLPELRLPYLLGMWSSAFAVNVTEVWKKLTAKFHSLGSQGENADHIDSSDEPPVLPATEVPSHSYIINALHHFLNARAGAAETFNYMRGFFMHWNYNKHPYFTAWKDQHRDAFPNQLTPSDCRLQLVDSGHVINIACAPILRPERKADIIIVLSYSWDPGDVLSVIRLTEEYCRDHHIPFPHVDWSRLEAEPQEVYVLEDEENPDAPVVVHFPLVNITYKHFKRPGVKRETPEELEAGSVDVSSLLSPYETLHLAYSERDYAALVDLAYYNVLNNARTLHDVIRKDVQRKRAEPQGGGEHPA